MWTAHTHKNKSTVDLHSKRKTCNLHFCAFLQLKKSYKWYEQAKVDGPYDHEKLKHSCKNCTRKPNNERILLRQRSQSICK